MLWITFEERPGVLYELGSMADKFIEAAAQFARVWNPDEEMDFPAFTVLSSSKEWIAAGGGEHKFN